MRNRDCLILKSWQSSTVAVIYFLVFFRSLNEEIRIFSTVERGINKCERAGCQRKRKAQGLRRVDRFPALHFLVLRVSLSYCALKNRGAVNSQALFW